MLWGVLLDFKPVTVFYQEWFPSARTLCFCASLHPLLSLPQLIPPFALVGQSPCCGGRHTHWLKSVPAG